MPPQHLDRRKDFDKCHLFKRIPSQEVQKSSRVTRTNYGPAKIYPKTLIEMWIICHDLVSANSEKGRGSEWAARVGQRLPSRFVQSGAAREMNLDQIVVHTIMGGFPST